MERTKLNINFQILIASLLISSTIGDIILQPGYPQPKPKEKIPGSEIYQDAMTGSVAGDSTQTIANESYEFPQETLDSAPKQIPSTGMTDSRDPVIGSPRDMGAPSENRTNPVVGSPQAYYGTPEQARFFHKKKPVQEVGYEVVPGAVHCKIQCAPQKIAFVGKGRSYDGTVTQQVVNPEQKISVNQANWMRYYQEQIQQNENQERMRQYVNEELMRQYENEKRMRQYENEERIRQQAYQEQIRQYQYQEQMRQYQEQMRQYNQEVEAAQTKSLHPPFYTGKKILSLTPTGLKGYRKQKYGWGSVPLFLRAMPATPDADLRPCLQSGSDGRRSDFGFELRDGSSIPTLVNTGKSIEVVGSPGPVNSWTDDEQPQQQNIVPQQMRISNNQPTGWVIEKGGIEKYESDEPNLIIPQRYPATRIFIPKYLDNDNVIIPSSQFQDSRQIPESQPENHEGVKNLDVPNPNQTAGNQGPEQDNKETPTTVPINPPNEGLNEDEIKKNPYEIGSYRYDQVYQPPKYDSTNDPNSFFNEFYKNRNSRDC